ncbi:hypothetical protein [Cupriavidus sp. DL-D2]|uniref:hypothetical protein n=1 Tax=Cupriavidus sp. DL-D2 TaxID=3144974 RepID=UPI003214CB60
MTTDFKRGQDFAYAGQILNNGEAMDFTGWGIAAQLRTALTRTLVQDLAVEFADAATGLVSLSASAAQSSVWPLELLVMDIRLQSPAGQVTLSNTEAINVVERVTHA